MQNMPPEDAHNQTIFTPLVPSVSGSQHPLPEESPVPPENNQPLFYTQEQDDDQDLHLPLLDEQDDQDDQAEQSSPFVFPFQNSAAMPTTTNRNAQGDRGSQGTPTPVAPPARRRRWGSFQLLKLLLIGLVVLLTVIGASLFVFAQPAPSPAPTQVHTTPNTQTTATRRPSPGTPSKPTQGPPTTQSSPQATATSSPPSSQGQGAIPSSSGTLLPSTQLLNQMGWTQAGFTLGDALEALRTGNTFTDREMSYDYRNIGTPTHHSGTLTGATFLLTAGGQVRFLHNDVRMINNQLYDLISSGKIIQQVVNAQPSLVQFQIVPIQGQTHLFVWVNVAFELLQSQSDPASGKRTEQLEVDPATGQPRLHHVVVVLVRQSPQTQGPNAPMGGTGWLVDTYARDTTTLPAIATDPSL